MKRVYLGLAIALLVVSSATAAAARPTETPAQRRQRVTLWNATVLWNRVALWNATILWNRVALWNATVKWNAEAHAHHAEPAPKPPPPSTHGACGGDLPPCYVMMRESGGSLTARNPTSSASGKWQFLDSTWAGFGGYARAYLAPESVQDARARQVWDHGRGCSAWARAAEAQSSPPRSLRILSTRWVGTMS